MTVYDAGLTSPQGWRLRFDAFIASRMTVPFAWGRNDCVLFPADGILAMEGVDHAADVRGSYETALQAMRLLEQHGGLDAIAARAGAAIAPLQAQVGDVGLVNNGSQSLLALCAGGVWLAPSAQGLAAFELGAATRAWRVLHG